MSNEMPSIDTSGIDALREVKDELDLVKVRLEKMIAMRDRVSEAVYEKVYSEYTDKLAEISAKAEPLKNRLRGQYVILRDLLERLHRELKEIDLDREELDFRFTLGEFDETYYAEQQRAWDVRHTSKQVELEEAEGMNEGFLSVFESQADLEVCATPVAPTPAPVAPTPAPVAPTAVIQQVVPVHEPLPEIVVAMPIPPAPPVPELPPLIEVDTDGDGDLGIGLDLDVSLEDDLVREEPPVVEASVEMVAPSFEDDPFANVPSDHETLMIKRGGIDAMDAMDGMEDDLIDDITDEHLTTEELIDDLDEDLGDFGGDLDDDLMDDLDHTGDLPPVPSLEEDTSSGDETLPHLLQGKDATMLMQQLPPQLPPVPSAPETMIIASPKIISMNSSTEGQTIMLGMGSTSLGRSPENDIHITEDRISRKHSQISFGPGGYAIYDLNSENGTFVNGQRIREHFLQDGDIIQVGTNKFLYRDH